MLTLSHKRLVPVREHVKPTLRFIFEMKATQTAQAVTSCRRKKCGNLALSFHLPGLHCCHAKPRSHYKIHTWNIRLHSGLSSGNLTNPHFTSNLDAWVASTTDLQIVPLNYNTTGNLAPHAFPLATPLRRRLDESIRRTKANLNLSYCRT
jgi:hypothetical protein